MPLDSTSVTEDGLAALRRANPRLTVHESERLALAWLRAVAGVEQMSDRSFPPFASKLVHQTGSVGLEVRFRGAATSEADVLPLKGLRQAEVLILSDAPIADDSLRCLRRLKQLKLLYLDGTNVGDDGMEHLSQLERLNVLSMARA